MASSLLVIARVVIRGTALLAILMLPGGLLILAGSLLALRRRPSGAAKTKPINTFPEESVRCVASP